MARRRRVGNLLALAVLSTVLRRPMHPYEMASLMRATGKEDDMAIKWGSFYTVVRNLTKHGLLEIVDTTRQGARPERTVYRITEAGRTELVDWVRELISTPEREHPMFKAGLSTLGVLPPAEAMRLLSHRLERLEQENAILRESLEQHRRDVPRLFLIENEYEIAQRESEAAWVRSLLDELMSGDFPDLAAWQEWHASGELPPEPSEGGDTG